MNLYIHKLDSREVREKGLVMDPPLPALTSTYLKREEYSKTLLGSVPPMASSTAIYHRGISQEVCDWMVISSVLRKTLKHITFCKKTTSLPFHGAFACRGRLPDKVCPIPVALRSNHLRLQSLLGLEGSRRVKGTGIARIIPRAPAISSWTRFQEGKREGSRHRRPLS